MYMSNLVDGRIGAATLSSGQQNWSPPASAATVVSVVVRPPVTEKFAVQVQPQSVVVQSLDPGHQISENQEAGLRAVVSSAVRLLHPSDLDDELTPTEPHILAAALERVLPLAVTDEFTPEFFPLSDGGVQVRWVSDRGSMQIEFDADNDVVILIDDRASGVSRSGYDLELWSAACHWLFQA